MTHKQSGAKEEKERQHKGQETVKEGGKEKPGASHSKEENGGDSDKEMKENETSHEKVLLEEEGEADRSEKKEEDIQLKLAELQDRYLRLSAEFDNYRKRTLRERIELTKAAGEDILVRLLPVMDDFDRAMSLMENVADCKAIKDGIDLIYNKMKDFLKQNGVKEIEAMNKDFDTDLHEAVTKIPATDKKKKGKVVDVIQKGYYLNDKIIRYSKVVVGE